MSSGFVNLLSIAEMVAEQKVIWEKNLAAAKARGEAETSYSVKESFAHYVAGLRIFIACVNGSNPGSNVPGRVVREAEKMIDESSAWTAYQESLKA